MRHWRAGMIEFSGVRCVLFFFYPGRGGAPVFAGRADGRRAGGVLGEMRGLGFGSRLMKVFGRQGLFGDEFFRGLDGLKWFGEFLENVSIYARHVRLCYSFMCQPCRNIPASSPDLTVSRPGSNQDSRGFPKQYIISTKTSRF